MRMLSMLSVRTYYASGTPTSDIDGTEVDLPPHLRVRFYGVVPRAGETLMTPGQPEGGQAEWLVQRVAHWAGRSEDSHLVGLWLITRNEDAETIVALARKDGQSLVSNKPRAMGISEIPNRTVLEVILRLVEDCIQGGMPGEAEIMGWDARTRVEVMKWACAHYLHTSVHDDIEIPEVPEVLQP